MATLEQFAAHVQDLSSQGHFGKLSEYVRRAVRDVLAKNAALLDGLFPVLSLQDCTMAVMAVLCAKLSYINSDQVLDTLPLVSDFFVNCNGEQARFLPDIYCKMCHRLAELLIQANESWRGILPLCRAIERLQISKSQMTSVHSDLLMLCLHARNLKPAVRFLDIDITQLTKERSFTPAFDCKYFLLYYYYGGMIYLALKNLEKALYFFEIVLTTPAQVVSAIMLETYKKWILAGLLFVGAVPSLPKYASPIVHRCIHPACEAYNDLAAAYTSNSNEALVKVFNKNRDLYARDKNLGLVKQVVSSMNKRNIQKLTKTFLTLSLTDVANRCKLQAPEEAEWYIVNMVYDCQILATISHKNGMVYFHDDQEHYDGLDVLQSVHRELDGLISLNDEIKTMDTEILLTPHYVQKIMKTSVAVVAHEDEGVSVAGCSSTMKDVPDMF